MKLIVVALVLATQVDAAQPTGHPCVTIDDCSFLDQPNFSMCCGVATGGKVCTDSKCSTVSEVGAANVVVCNVRIQAEDFKISQPDAAGANPITIKYMAPGFTCGAKQLVASGIAFLAAASIM